jgi:hypothetical protein
MESGMSIYTETSGDWEIVNEQIRTEDDDAILLYNATPAIDDSYLIVVYSNESRNYDEDRMTYFAWEDANNHLFVAVTLERQTNVVEVTISLYSVISGSKTLLDSFDYIDNTLSPSDANFLKVPVIFAVCVEPGSAANTLDVLVYVTYSLSTLLIPLQTEAIRETVNSSTLGSKLGLGNSAPSIMIPAPFGYRVTGDPDPECQTASVGNSFGTENSYPYYRWTADSVNWKLAVGGSPHRWQIVDEGSPVTYIWRGPLPADGPIGDYDQGTTGGTGTPTVEAIRYTAWSRVTLYLSNAFCGSCGSRICSTLPDQLEVEIVGLRDNDCNCVTFTDGVVFTVDLVTPFPADLYPFEQQLGTYWEYTEALPGCTGKSLRIRVAVRRQPYDQKDLQEFYKVTVDVDVVDEGAFTYGVNPGMRYEQLYSGCERQDCTALLTNVDVELNPDTSGGQSTACIWSQQTGPLIKCRALINAVVP